MPYLSVEGENEKRVVEEESHQQQRPTNFFWCTVGGNLLSPEISMSLNESAPRIAGLF
jgi:hypothetical protein